jgi:hypothetical protein
VHNALFSYWASDLWGLVNWVRRRIGVPGDQPHPDDWEADREWLAKDALPILELALMTVKDAGVTCLLGPYVDAIDDWEAAGRDPNNEPFPAFFRQNVIDLHHALREVDDRILPRMQVLASEYGETGREEHLTNKRSS